MQPSRLFLLAILLAGAARAQTQPAQVRRFLEPSLQTPDVVAHQLRQYLVGRAPLLPVPTSAAKWTAEAARLRRELLDNVVFHGWPREWVTAPLQVEERGEIPSAPGYRLRKLRYEIVPGFFSTAILYEPDTALSRIPAVLNVNGHVGAPGKAVEYKQKRCIAQARQGILSLNLEWLGYGELAQPENRHWFGAHLDLTGANAAGLFYLAMRKGLDYLWEHPRVDRTRIGVTGLSGGGWQTIVLSALDERVQVSIPVAGYASLVSRLERPGDAGDIEQNPSDLLTGIDYSHLTAMRAPRPTLLIYNAEDDCCFRAPLVKPYIFDQVQPFFRLYGSEAALAWHENTDPADHNYQLDNRLQSYRFFARHFRLPAVEAETVAGDEIRTAAELTVGLPKENLTILSLARSLAARISPRSGDRARLASTLRYKETSLTRAWALRNTRQKGLETRSYRFDFSNGLGATGVRLNAVATPEPAPATVVLRDQGKKESGAEVSERLNRGEQVLAADLLFTGDAAPQEPGPSAYTQLLATVGDRPLGLEAAQLIALARWLQPSPAAKIRIESSGIRNQVVALLAAALAPGLFSEVMIRGGMPSFRYLLEAPVEYRNAPELFCLDLYKQFDLDRLAELAAPAKITVVDTVK